MSSISTSSNFSLNLTTIELELNGWGEKNRGLLIGGDENKNKQLFPQPDNNHQAELAIQRFWPEYY